MGNPCIMDLPGRAFGAPIKRGGHATDYAPCALLFRFRLIVHLLLQRLLNLSFDRSI